MKHMFDLHEMVRVKGGSYKGLEGFIYDVQVDENNNTIYGIKFSEYDDLLYKLAKDIESIDKVEDDVIPCPVTLGEYEELVKEKHCCGGNCGCDGKCGDACKCKNKDVELKVDKCDCGCCHHEEVELPKSYNKKSLKEYFDSLMKKFKIK